MHDNLSRYFLAERGQKRERTLSRYNAKMGRPAKTPDKGGPFDEVVDDPSLKPGSLRQCLLKLKFSSAFF